MNDPHAPFDLRLGREAPPTFAHRLEKMAGRRRDYTAWRTFLPAVDSYA